MKITQKDLKKYKYLLKNGYRSYSGWGKKKRDIIYCPSHPNTQKNGFVLYHRLVKEVQIGRYLKKDEIVHHRDGNGQNHNPKNLKIEYHGVHSTKHNLDIGQKWYGFRCPICRTYFEKRIKRQNDSWKRGKQGPFCSQPCASEAGQSIIKGEWFGKTPIVRRFVRRKKARYGLSKITN